ncbi:TPA: hypothetical protein RPG34_003423 [Yersinia enterocolitica]|nr:hypothetical protein [Yersinia enterocolitica]
MTPEERQSALLSAAKNCNNEIKTTLADLPANTNKDSITRPIILRHYEKIKPLGYKLAWLQAGLASFRYWRSEWSV